MSTHQGWMSSIRLKAVGVVFALNVVLVVFLATYFPARHIDSVRREIRDKAATYARLVAKQVEPGVAFDDRETIREVFTATAEDNDVRAIALYSADGRSLFTLGEFATAIAVPNEGVRPIAIAVGSSFVRATISVVSREGPTGTLVLEVSTDRVEAERQAIQRTALLVGLGALALGFAAAWAIGRSIGQRLGTIARATQAVADGDLTVRTLEDKSSDEVGQLARSFNAMFTNIRALLDHIRETNARETERLDALVKVRTQELDERNRDMRLVLDNVNQGLLVVERSGRIAKERSAVVARWFGEVDATVAFWDCLQQFDAEASASFRLNWEALLDDVMPAELSIAQLPRGLRAGAHEFELEYTPLFEGAILERMLVVVSDVTQRRAAERAESEQREVVCAFGHIMRDRTGFLEFFDEARFLIDKLCAAERPEVADVKRWLHTLKGNASLFGLTALGSFCHSLEDAMGETGADLSVAQRQALFAHWDAFATRFGALLGDRDEGQLPIDKAEYDALLQALIDGRPRKAIAEMVAAWRLELASYRLTRHAAQAQALALRLGKGAIDVAVDADRLRLSREVLAPFWSAFGHAVRNAVDHGIESQAERDAAGKVARGSIRMSAFRSNGRVTVEIADDGRGVDWRKVTEKAGAAGLPCASEQDLVAALWCDGISTRDEADQISGRGVGMGALRAECEKLGGRMSLVSKAGKGTSIRFVFDADLVGETEETRRAEFATIRLGSGSMASRPPQASTEA